MSQLQSLRGQILKGSQCQDLEGLGTQVLAISSLWSRIDKTIGKVKPVMIQLFFFFFSVATLLGGRVRLAKKASVEIGTEKSSMGLEIVEQGEYFHWS